jgi:hypothetical protein
MTLPYDINRRNSLLDKFRNDMLDRDEAEELKQILEIERKQAAQLGDFLLVISLSALLALVIEFLSKQRWGFLFGKRKKKRGLR